MILYHRQEARRRVDALLYWGKLPYAEPCNRNRQAKYGGFVLLTAVHH